MMHIDAVPKGVFSWGYDLTMGNAPLVSFDVAWARERGSFDWEGIEYELSREVPLFGDFVISDRGGVIARAGKDSAFLRAFTVRFGEREFRFRAAHPMTRRFVLEEQGNAVGEICPYLFSRKCRAEFPESLPIPVCVFLLWLAVLIWRRQAAAAGS
jgi:hypothetical protein